MQAAKDTLFATRCDMISSPVVQF